jgi:magnesium transporter
MPWLIFGLFGGIVSSLVIGRHESDLRIYPEMAFFIPLIGAMGGNAGVQSATIVVQGLANKSLIIGGIAGKLFKEFLVALINGLTCAVIILGYTFFITNTQYVGLTVSISLLIVIIFASLFGTFVPLALNKFKIDPALATGPFVTTANDIIGLTLYFIVGRMMYAG